MRIILFCEQKYAISILRPIDLRAREEGGHEILWYVHRENIPTFPLEKDVRWTSDMQEVYDLFVRDILTNMERKNLPKKHPEYELLLNEYRDGILLFNISNDKIWNKPMAEQKALEEAWIQELRAKYPVEVNWKALEKAVRK